MPLTNWKILLKGVDRVDYQYATTLLRTCAPIEAEELRLRLVGQLVRCVVTEVHKDFVTKSGVEIFTVHASEIVPPPR